MKFTPLFLVLYPIHRAQWYQGGSLADYLLCRKSCCSYKRSQAYKDPQYPRCVRPDTNKISETGLTNLRGLARGGSLSTIRRRHDRDAMLSVRRGEADPYAMAPMPTPQADLEARAEPTGRAPCRLRAARNSATRSPFPSRNQIGRRRRARGARLGGARRRRPVRRLSYTPGASEASAPTRRRSPRSRSSCRTRWSSRTPCAACEATHGGLSVITIVLL